MIEKIDHVGIAVRDLKRAIDIFEKFFGFSLIETIESEEEKTREAFMVSSHGKTGIDLMESIDPTGPIGRYVERAGEGIHHISLAVSDVDEISQRIRDEGGKLIYDKTMLSGKFRYNFVHPKSLCGVLVELLQRLER
jgi:methylmalonyl-CoA epimerase